MPPGCSTKSSRRTPRSTQPSRRPRGEGRSSKQPGSGNRLAGCKAKAGQSRKIRRLRAECVTIFKISKLAYKTQVWPAARKMAGLGKAKAGRPPAKMNRLPISRKSVRLFSRTTPAMIASETNPEAQECHRMHHQAASLLPRNFRSRLMTAKEATWRVDGSVFANAARTTVPRDDRLSCLADGQGNYS